MGDSRQLLRGTMILTLGQLVSYGLSFARNIILARTLAKADFGLAAVFSMTVVMLEVAGRMAFGQQIVQSKEGGSVAYGATSQAFQFVLSVGGALLILALSYPMAKAMHVSHITWAFVILAVVPLARGFEHLDYFRQQRDLNYLPTALYELVPQTVITLAAWPMAKWLGDFRVIVWLMVAKALMAIVTTHLLAKRPYRWAWERAYIVKMWGFGWPLLLNGLLIFASQQADQILVGAFLSLENLAAYALALSLVSIPGTIFAGVASTLMLPILARAQDDLGQFTKRFRTCMQYAGIVAVALTLPLIVAGEQFAAVVYGPKYTDLGILMALLGAAAAVRFLRIVPAIASMARADTMNQLYSNLCRGISLPLAATVAVLGGSVNLIAACALCAELAAAAVSVVRLSRRQHVHLREMGGAIGYLFVFVGGGLILALAGSRHWSLLVAASCGLTILVVSLVVAAFAFPEATRMLVTAVMRRDQPKLNPVPLNP
ncbi:MAG: tuaB [Verrucomicrobia bacterium]|nr:tuaB [Verrucomicrobiota bacterium]